MGPSPTRISPVVPVIVTVIVAAPAVADNIAAKTNNADNFTNALQPLSGSDEARIEGHAAVNVNGCSVHVVRLIRGQPHGCARYVLRFADPFCRHQLE